LPGHPRLCLPVAGQDEAEHDVLLARAIDFPQAAATPFRLSCPNAGMSVKK
jgi:hypothetical protein